ncbi:N-acetylmuramoyl-L-alanine amidase [Nocardioides sp. SOB77]|uniref:N-acetylmuramoyl-L-alanine amidase n=1 Tax=Nocardioides oceani TaxID=3058369 RepID=A0ABT8FH81_9ACTN|nr:N-acetylmuramoyl-L-alanine amidase [Nocardioides oceani]MDN4173906.1 N-acetylmuramoyl-L-alanine amidase [Nocardioides oceani]
MPVAPPSPPYVGPPKWRGGSNNKPIRRVVIHCTAGAEPGVPGAARATARYTRTTPRPSSWHYCRDAREAVQLTWDSVVAYHDGTNDNSLGYELCCSLSNEGRSHWADDAHQAMLAGAAEDVARLCLANDLPIRLLTPAQIRAGERGICGHNTMRDAFPGSTSHWDPGPHFPWDDFLRQVRAAAERLTRPTPPPATRVEQARDLLTAAADRAKGKRLGKIRAALQGLPKR